MGIHLPDLMPHLRPPVLLRRCTAAPWFSLTQQRRRALRQAVRSEVFR